MRGGYFPRWEPHEDAFLCRWWGKCPATGIAGTLRRSTLACYSRASKLGLKSERRARVLRGDGEFLGAEFYTAILEEFATRTAGQIARRHGVTVNRARTWVHRAKKYRDRGKLG